MLFMVMTVFIKSSWPLLKVMGNHKGEGIKRKIIALSIIFIFVYIGSMFGEGYSNIFFTFISFLFSLYICKLPSKFLSSQKKNFLFKVLF